MRGIGRTFSRLPVARALIAGAAILAGAAAHADSADPGAPGSRDETAMAIPRVALPGKNPGVAMPQPLDPSDAARIRRIFAWQQRGDIPAAARAAAEIEDPLLAGHILADRYLGCFHRATPNELTNWLDHYPDLPDAPAIHALLMRRLPKGTTAPPLPRLEALPIPSPAVPAPLKAGPPSDERGERSRASVAARMLFTGNRDPDALRAAMAVLHKARPDQPVGEVGFIAGLAAWRLGRIDLAEARFEAAAMAIGPGRTRAAAAFWAARAHLRQQDEAGYVGWLRRAAEERRTFYGLIAGRTLGLDAGPMSGGALVATEADVEAIAATPRGWRALALLQVGQPERAEAELRLLWPEMKDSAPLRRSTLLIAASVGLTELAAQLAAVIDAQEGPAHDDLRFAVPRLRPAGGFRIDPALVYALTRLESNFDATAVSPAGARGLMQIMPVTARYVMRSEWLDGAELHDPSLNLDVGQRYVAYLGRQDGIEGDLIRLLASYNAGPGSFLRWSGAVRDEDDPLLFIEAIPNDETRAFVQHVLTYTWIYAARLRLPAPSLDEIAAGEFPRFTPLAAEGKLPVAAPRVH
jgi:soluble lytic murein transglycosylase